jgi:hypothetical protein
VNGGSFQQLARYKTREHLTVSNLAIGSLAVGRKQTVLLLAKLVKILRRPDA